MSSSTADQISKSRFRPGEWWEWLYRDPQGVPSSWERYSVRASQGAEVIVDMATKFDEGEAYQTHHRMRLSLADIALGEASGELAIWCRNALDDDTATNFIDFGPAFGGLTVANFEEPRTLGITGIVRW